MRPFYLHCSLSIALSQLINLTGIQTAIFGRRYTFDPPLIIEDLHLHNSLVSDKIFQISVCKDFMLSVGLIVEKHFFLLKFAYGWLLIRVDDEDMGALFIGGEVVTEQSFEERKPALYELYQWTRRRGIPAKSTEAITKSVNLK